jgi:glycosyltransferase involved in cell wall biosynthesis
VPDFQPRFSIVLPVRNGAKYIRATLEHILQQTYSNFKVLVLENCSEDDTLAIVQSFDDARIQILPAANPLSIEENWKRIVDLPLSEWMTIVSHDDLLYPTFLQEMNTLIEADPDASLYTAHFDMIDADGNMIRRSKEMEYRENGDAFLLKRQQWQYDSFGSGYVMRSADYRRVGGIPLFHGLYYADDVLWATLANLGARVCSPKTLYAYRYFRSSSARQMDLLSLYDASKDYLDFLKTRPVLQTEKNIQLSRRYTARHFNRQYQRFLVNLISASDAQQGEAYRQTKSALQKRAAEDKLFPVYNPILAIIERVALLPSVKLRRLILKVMEKTAQVIYRFTG